MTMNEHRAKVKKAIPRRGAPRREAAPLDDNKQIVGQTDIFNDIPVLPYAGTSGWSGSDTSRARAVEADRDGTTTARQLAVLSELNKAGYHGLTWKELSDITGWHHGQASGALSNLHKEERIARLAESRHRCKVYTLPEYVNGRETESQGRKPRATNPDPVPVPDPPHIHVWTWRDSTSSVQDCRECGATRSTADIEHTCHPSGLYYDDTCAACREERR